MSTVKQAQSREAGSRASQSDEDSSSNEEAVASFLDSHPDFFERHGTLLGKLRLPHSTGGQAVSLIERQVSVLRQRNDGLETQLRELVEVARGNDDLADKIHSLAIMLIGAGDRDQVVELLEQQLRLEFNADRAVLVLFDQLGAGAEEPGQFLRLADRDDAALGPFRSFLDGGVVRCGTVRDAQRDFLFGADNFEIGSIALIPLGEGSAIGFLAIGSRNADHFHPGVSIDFLARLGELVAAALAR
ncbi:MAG: DUF484 family protein [Gammaproteobacteria bacterium]|nr:DUF484 family protein [Gammaproteobacteria bacterium]